MTKLIYEGPHLEVEVPSDAVAGGVIYAERGVAVDVPADVAESLLSQGENSDPDGEHERTWRKATAKETQAGEKPAAKSEGGEAS